MWRQDIDCRIGANRRDVVLAGNKRERHQHVKLVEYLSSKPGRCILHTGQSKFRWMLEYRVCIGSGIRQSYSSSAFHSAGRIKLCSDHDKQGWISIGGRIMVLAGD